MRKLSRGALHYGRAVFVNMCERYSTCPTYSHTVLHDDKKRQFYINIDEERAFISYKKSKGVVDLQHTEVPEKCRGHGVAAVLAKGTFDFIKENNLQMRLTCDYLQSYYKKNRSEELANLLVEKQRTSL